MHFAQVSLYRSELLAIHFNCKSRPAPNDKRGTEVCLPHNFAIDSSGKTSILGKANTTPPSSSRLALFLRLSTVVVLCACAAR